MYPPSCDPDADRSTPCARLLVVDDNPLVRKLHARVLAMAGYDVRTAEDGISALEQLAEETFDLVLTDKHMPNLNGAHLVLALRSAGSRIPVVMVSGSLTRQALPDAVAREIFATLTKPARTSEVLSAIALALHSVAPRKEVLSFRGAQAQPA